MKSQSEFLAHIASLLTDCEIPFMVAGSMGSTHYGEPRSTIDIDIVIDPTPDQLRRFIGQLSDDHYADLRAALSALSLRSMFNIIDTTSGWKVDLIIRKNRPFSVTEFQRRTQVLLLGVLVPLASPEDIVLSKLEWAKKSESERQIRDARSVLKTMRQPMDFSYLRHWAAELGVEDLLNDILPERTNV